MLRVSALAAIANLCLALLLKAAGPNLILVMTDGAIPEEAKAGAISLDLHFASPTDAASRAALLTGVHEFRGGVSHTRDGRSLLKPGIPTLADMFHAAGYRTAVFGNWHLGDAYPCRPEDRGFDDVLVRGGGGIGDAPDAWGNSGGSARRKEGWRPIEGSLEDEACRWLKTRAGEEKKPFFLCYFSDEDSGGLLKALDESGAASETVVVVTSSHGKGQGPGEEGTQAPCLIRWPGKIAAGKGVNTITSHLDMLPTLTSLCEVKRPDGWMGDGVDLSAALLGKASFPVEREIFSQLGGWPGDQAAGRFRGRDFSVRDSRWRLSGLELFDMAGDPSKNVFEANPQEMQRLLTDYGRWWEGVLPLVREPVRYVIGAEEVPLIRLTSFDWWPSKETDAGAAAPCHTQQQIRDFLKAAQVAATRNPLSSTSGHWKLQATREGSYEISFALLPPEATAEERSALGRLRLGVAHIRAGQEETRIQIKEGATSFRMPVDLDAGPLDLEIWFDGQLLNDRILGAFFASVEYKGPRKIPKPEFKAAPRK